MKIKTKLIIKRPLLFVWSWVIILISCIPLVNIFSFSQNYYYVSLNLELFYYFLILLILFFMNVGIIYNIKFENGN
jgi:hypothetical protein